MSNAKNTSNSSISNKRIVIKYDFTLCVMDVQLDKREIGIINVVNNTKYMDKPSIPK